jgi:hypothetical protein
MTVIGLALFVVGLFPIGLAAVENEHVELGTISWSRDYDQALARASKTNRPVLILFQEVPGCATCRNYGLRVLSHPLLAEAAEDLFIPLAVFNNRPGADAQVLKLFGEPSWNNPVVRIVDPSGRELTRRLAGDYSAAGFSGAMIDALETVGNPVPLYLRTLHTELSSLGFRQTAYFSMFCFWQGEIQFGGVPGVVATTAGFIQGREVVEVEFDSSRLSYADLVRQAKKLRCAERAFPVNDDQRATAKRILGKERVLVLKVFRPDRNTKYYLSHTPYRYLPMTEYQKVLLNRATNAGADLDSWISPRQRQALGYIRRNLQRQSGDPWRPLLASSDFREDWTAVWKRLEP